jgi:hypothetical protein
VVVSDVFIKDEKGNVYAIYRRDGWDAVGYVHPGGTTAFYGDAGAMRQLDAAVRALASLVR